MKVRASVALVLFAAIAPPTLAQESIEPDRPDVTNGTHIVGTGLVQVEFGGIFTHDNSLESGFGSPLTVRVGITDWLEARLGADGLLVANSGDESVSGFGNVQVGGKIRLWADPGGVPVLSILPVVNLPTGDASKGFGSGDADYLVAVLTGTDLWKRGHIDVNYGIGAIGSGESRPHVVQHSVSASASVAIGSRWNPYGEVFWFSKADADSGALTAADFGAIYTFTSRLALDGGAQFGASDAAPSFAVFGGLSVVVGQPNGGHVHERQRKTAKGGRPRLRR